jgi:tetraacyldisaccharide 4'-kinase
MHYKDVGDESLIHASYGSTCVSKNKIKGAELCKKNGADLIILDDGLQSINVKKKMSLLVIDSSYGIKNRFLFPSGPLRQLTYDALKSCDGIVILDKNFNKKKYEFISHKNIYTGYRELKFSKKIKNKVIAFSALGNNQNFFENLLDHKVKVEEFISFPDHHKFSIIEINNIIEKSKKKKLSVICTRKDYIKVPDKFKKKICVADLNLRINNSEKFRKFILKTLKK